MEGMPATGKNSATTGTAEKVRMAKGARTQGAARLAAAGNVAFSNKLKK